ncbi:response regulator [Winogradskyella pulchriflava]|uniref:Response regulator n=1 Tax=Winogradskyella pulchriflava TaxID=1110688 RepID=A0ABV6Q9E8_9FLAO
MKLNFMLIDDNKIDLFICKKIIEKSSSEYSVRTFQSAQSAIKFLEIFVKKEKYQDAFLPNVILLDINMPEMNGFQFLREFNKLEHFVKRPIKIFMLSSSTDIHDVIKVKSEKLCVRFISKPLTVEGLHNVVRESIPFSIEHHYSKNNRVKSY